MHVYVFKHIFFLCIFCYFALIRGYFVILQLLIIAYLLLVRMAEPVKTKLTLFHALVLQYTPVPCVRTVKHVAYYNSRVE